VSSDGKTVTFTPALENRHFSGEVDVGFDKEEVVLNGDDGSSMVFAADAITYGPAELEVDGDDVDADAELELGDGHGWDYLLGLPIVQPGSSFNACESPSPEDSELFADEPQLVYVAVSTEVGCSITIQVANLEAAGAIGVLVHGDDSQLTLNEVGTMVPTMVLSSADGDALNAMLANNVAVTLNAKPVELRASVGNLHRGIVVRGHIDDACTAEEHAANLKAYEANCQQRNKPHHVCFEEGYIPHDCFYMKGYGVHMITGEVNYGSQDEYEDALASGQELPPTQLGQINARGVEFRDFGKLSMKHRGFVINYFSDTAPAENNVTNVIDRCVFRHSWQDGIVISRAPAVTLTDNIVHKTLGVGISTGDRFINWGERQRERAARSMVVSNEMPNGGLHTIDGNLVSDSFWYPFAETDSSVKTHHWHSGMALRHDMASLKDNVVAGAAHAGMSFRMQDAQHLKAGEHVVDNNEAYGATYGAVALNQVAGEARELYNFKAWKNTRAGIVGFDETSDIQIRKATLSDNKFGVGISFVPSATLRVVESTVIGTSDATVGCPGFRIGLMLPRYGVVPRCEDTFGPCKECAIEGNMMDMRFGNTQTGREEHFYIEANKFAHFGDNAACGVDDSLAVAINPDENDYTPETWLSQITWLPSVAKASRMQLGAVNNAHADCGDDASCDAVNYMKFHDVDGSSIGGKNAGKIMYSDRNPAATVEPKCRADTDTGSIICKNYDPPVMEVHVPPPCNDGCLPPRFITVHKYGAEGMNGAQEKRTFWTMGAFEQGCSCQKHFMGGSFPAEAGENLIYDVDMPIEDALNKPGEFEPEWIPPNTKFIYHSNDPTECVLLRLRMLTPNPVMLMLNGKSMDDQKLTDGSFPTVSSAPGTNVLDPQARRFFMNACGAAGGKAEYMLRVKEAVQVTMEIEMSLAEFFAEEIPTQAEIDAAGGSVGLVQRTTGLDRLVNNFAQLLSIPSSKIKVVCIHKAGEPCIPDELSALLGGFNVGGRARSRRADSSSGTGAYQVEMDIVPPNSVEDTGDDSLYAENLNFLEQVQTKLDAVTSDSSFSDDLVANIDGATVMGVSVAATFGSDAAKTDIAVTAVGEVVAPVTTASVGGGEATGEADNGTSDGGADGDGVLSGSTGGGLSPGGAAGVTIAVLGAIALAIFLYMRYQKQTAADNKAVAATGAATVEGIDSYRPAVAETSMDQQQEQHIAVDMPQEYVARAQMQRDSILSEFGELPILRGSSVHTQQQQQRGSSLRRSSIVKLEGGDENAFELNGGVMQRRSSLV